MTHSYRDYFSSSARVDVVLELEKITESVVDLVFGEENKDLRVFLFLDDDEQLEIARRLGLSTIQGFESHLCDRLRRLPRSDNPLEVLDIMWHATNRWRANGDALATPPAIPLLLMFSYAARAMGEGDSPAHAYYVHLKERLNLARQDDLQRKYASELSLSLWKSLEEWLDAWQDERGISTVVFPDKNLPPNRKYIRMAESQALLRSHDHENLGKMFSHYNLDSSMPVPESIMEAMIDGWTSLSMCSPRLKTNWKRSEAREAIVVGALAHLAKWSPEEADGTSDGISLGLTLIPTRRTGNVDIFIDIRTKRPLRDPKFEILARDGAWTPISVFGLESLRLRIDSIDSIAPEAKLEQVIQGRVTSTGSTTEGKRNPRSIVPLLQQPTKQYTESSSVLLGLPHALLVRTDKVPTLINRITDILRGHADIGWRILPPEERRNLPSNWEFIENVKMIKLVDPNLMSGHGLEVFEMVEANVVDFSGGQRVPGRIPRWIVNRPPAITGVFPGGDVARLKLVGNSLGRESEVVCESEVSDGLVRLDLATASPNPGTYSLVASTDDGAERLLGDIRLVSPNSPDPTSLLNRRPLASAVGRSNPKGFTTSEPLLPEIGDSRLEGMYLCGSVEEAGFQRHRIPNHLPPIDRTSENQGVTSPILLAEVSPPECAFFAHYWVLQPENPDQPRTMDSSRCRHCGRVKDHSRRGIRKKIKPLRGDIARHRGPEVRNNSPELIQAGTTTRLSAAENWNDAFESLCFLIQGTYKDFLTISSHVTTGALAASTFWKNLFYLGHIEVQCDDLNHPHRWFVNPPTLTILNPNRGFFSGFRSEYSKAELEAALKVHGYHLCIEPHAGFVDYWFAEASDTGSASTNPPLSEIEFPSELKLRISDDLPSNLIRALASISTVRAGLRKVKIFGSEAQWWNPRSRRWSSTSQTDRPGSYQTKGFAVSYFFNESDLALDDYSKLATYDLVKHLSAQQIGEPLCAYNSEESTLIVPRGAELPRLYGRAVAACSGLLPESRTVDGVNMLVYRNVPLEVAETIYQLLLS